MNPWQMAQQLKHLLGAVKWPGSSGEVVFGKRSVFVYAGSPPSEEEMPPAFPFALVTIDEGATDEDDPGILEQRFTVVTAVQVAGDPLGEHAVIGSSRADLLSSSGAGIAEVAERVRAGVQSLTGADGAALVVSGSGVSGTNTLGEGRQVAFEEFSVSAVCTSEPFYAQPQELTLSGSTWKWEGSQCSSRFDFKQFRVGYVTGSDAVEDPADLTATIYTGTDTEAVEYQTIGSGGSAFQAAAPVVSGRVYQVFADYTPRGGSGVENTSDGRLVGSFSKQ